jgi:hypothetical protein
MAKAQSDKAGAMEIFPLADYAFEKDSQQKFKAKQSAVLSLPADSDTFTVSCDRAHLPKQSADLLECRVNISFDEGKTWQSFAFKAGGTGLNPRGEVETQSSLTVAIPRGEKKIAPLVKVDFTPLKNIKSSVSFLAENKGVAIHDSEEPHSVAFNAVSSTSASNVSSVTFTHTPSGSPSAIGVGVAKWPNTSISGITYGGVPLVHAVTSSTGGGGDVAAIWGLANPPTGAQSVIVNFSAGGQYPTVGCVSVVGSDTTTCFTLGHTGSATGTSTTPTVSITSAAGELVLSVVSQDPDTGVLTAGGTATNRWSVIYGGARGQGATEDGTTSHTASFSTGVSQPWCIVAAAFKEAAAGGLSIKNVSGLPIASVKSIGGLPIASVKKRSGAI